MLWQVRTLLHDTRMMVSGLADIVRYARDVERVESSISLFTAPSYVVHAGEGCRYRIVLANATSEERFQRLMIDIYLKDNPVHPQGHHSWFEKKILLRKEGNTIVDLLCNWNDLVSFEIDGATVPPDRLWRGDPAAAGKYLIRAALFDPSEKLIEELELVQMLLP